MRPVQRGTNPPVTPQTSNDDGLGIPRPTVVLKPGEMPGIAFDSREHDFGRIRTDRDVMHEYRFTNTGNGPLEILRVKPSCGCTTAGEFDRIIPPGGQGRIPIKLTANRVDKTFSKTITVNTNIVGPDRTVQLSFKGEVWRPVEVTPKSAAFGRLTLQKAGSAPPQRLTIISNVPSPMTPTNVRCDNPRFRAEVRPNPGGRTYELIVSIVPPLLTGNNTGTIRIDTGLSEAPTIEIAAYALVAAPVDVSPAVLTVTPGRSASIQRKFYIRSNDGQPFEIRNLVCTSTKLSMSVSETASGRQNYCLTLDIPSDYAPPASGDRITFETTHPAARSFTIPITAR